MSRKRKHLEYTFPGSKRASRQQRLIWWSMALVVGIVVAVGMGAMFYMKDRF